MKTALRKNAAEITAEIATERSIRSQLSERAGLIEATKDIDKILTDARITWHQRWYTEQKLLEDARQQGALLSNRLGSSMTP